MSDSREQKFLEMVQAFPSSPMAHFSLGKHYLSERRYAEAAGALEEAVRLDATYAAALVSLGDAYAGAGETQRAREVLKRARGTALAQSHASLAEEIDARLQELG